MSKDFLTTYERIKEHSYRAAQLYRQEHNREVMRQHLALSRPGEPASSQDVEHMTNSTPTRIHLQADGTKYLAGSVLK
jgi:hypothetical protein